MKWKFAMPVLLGLVIFLACNKDSNTSTSLQSDAQKTSLSTITSNWIEQVSVHKNGQPSERALALKNSLIMEQLSYIKISNNATLIMVPMKASYPTHNNADSLRVTNFTLIVDAAGKVQSTQIVQYLSSKENLDKLNAQELASVLQTRSSKLDGSFYVLKSNGVYMYDLRFSKGKLIHYAKMSKKVSQKQQSKDGANCFDYYLFSYGQDENGDWYANLIYLGTWCDDGCQAEGPHGEQSICDEFDGDGAGGAADCGTQLTDFGDAVNNSVRNIGTPTETITSTVGTTRNVTEEWSCVILGTSGWGLSSHEHGTRVFNAGNSKWEWTSITHDYLFETGTKPAGVDYSIVSEVATPLVNSFGARMSLSLDIAFIFVDNCVNAPFVSGVPPVTQHYSAPLIFPN